MINDKIFEEQLKKSFLVKKKKKMVVHFDLGNDSFSKILQLCNQGMLNMFLLLFLIVQTFLFVYNFAEEDFKWNVENENKHSSN